MMGIVRIVITAGLLVASVVLTVLSIVTQPFFTYAKNAPLTEYTAALWVVFALSFFTLRKVRTRAAIILVIAGSVGIGVAAMSGPPNTSTDSARYAWDGIVQDAGLSPYDYAATSNVTASLRPSWLFPTPITNPITGVETCTGSRIQQTVEPGSTFTVCTAINRGRARTIYPPAAEILFAVVRFIVGPDAQYWPMQLVGLLIGIAITLLLIRGLLARGLNPRWAALWAWCPLWATEGVTNSHIDMLGTLFLLIAALSVSSGKPWRGGIALGVAIAAKLIPVIGAPALLRGRSWKIVVAAIGVFVLLYVPYVIGSGIQVLGYLPSYLNEEGYDDGSRFALVSYVIHGKAATVVVVVLLAIVAFLVWRKTDPKNPWLGEVVMIGVALLVLSPRYPWYGLMLVPMIAMSGRWEWLTVPLALTVRGLIPHDSLFREAELVAIAVVVAMSIWRAGPGWPRRVVRELAHPWRAPAGAMVDVGDAGAVAGAPDERASIPSPSLET